MTDEELRKLKRGDLLELLVAQGKETEELRQKLAQAEEGLNSRRIQLNEAGNIAEAALRMNGVFEAAQASAAQYLETIRLQSQETEALCARMETETKEKTERLMAETQETCTRLETEAREKADRLMAETQETCTRLETETQEKADRLMRETEAKCAAMVAQAEAETREFWDMVSKRLENFYNEHAGLRELLSLEQLRAPAPAPAAEEPNG